MGKWFGSSGIRGAYENISPDFAMSLGRAVQKAKSENEWDTAYIASDIRLTSDILKSAFMSGFNSAGGEVIDIGKTTTPVIAFLSQIESTLGVMITASHNPPMNNGFKFFIQGGEGDNNFEKRVESELSQYLSNTGFESNSWDKVGYSFTQDNRAAVEKYIQYLLSQVNLKRISMVLCVDCANNVPNQIAKLIFKNIETRKVIYLNEKLDGLFPGRPSEPTAQNLKRLKEIVLEESADIGIAQDGDGDRFAIIDEKGQFITPTALISFFIDHLDYSNPDENVVVLTSDCTQQSFDIARKHGAEVITSKIGRNRDFVSRKDILFLAEPNKLMFPNFGKWIDGFYPVLKLLELAEGRTISSVLRPYDKRRVLRKAFIITEKLRRKLEKQIFKLPDMWSESVEQVSKLDGLKIYFKDKSSVLIRFSGTEPKIRFYIESDSIQENSRMLDNIQRQLEIDSEGYDC
ncbi:MAG: hypothetical protein ACTSW1_09210 [Candidatus Hodarchaeales archaeon]